MRRMLAWLLIALVWSCALGSPAAAAPPFDGTPSTSADDGPVTRSGTTVALPLAAFAQRVYVGTYTRGGRSEGIYGYSLDVKTGKLTPLGTAGGVTNPSFLAIYPSHQQSTQQYLYAVAEVSGPQGKPAGGVVAFAVDRETGQLRMLNQQPSGGGGPCHLSVDATGKCVLVAHYTGGSVAALPISADGSLGEVTSLIQHTGSSVDPRRQTAPHAHSVNIDAANQFAFVADLGLDKVLIYRLDPAAAKLTPHDPPYAATPPGGGPRHLAIHPAGQFVYVNNELTSSVTAFRYDAQRGALETIETVDTLPDGFERQQNTTAEVQVHPSGKFLYVSNRGHDSIAIFGIDQQTGRLTPLGHQPTGGQTPRNFGVDISGTWLLAANQASNNIHVFRIDTESGRLLPTEHSVEVPAPVCVKFASP